MKHSFKKGHHWSTYKVWAERGFTKSETARLMGVSRQAVHSTALRYHIEFTRKCSRGGVRYPSIEKVLWSSPETKSKWEKSVGKSAEVRTKKIIYH